MVIKIQRILQINNAVPPSANGVSVTLIAIVIAQVPVPSGRQAYGQAVLQVSD